MKRLCGHKGCYASARCGLGWGLGTGLVLWYCPLHLPVALARLSGLLAAIKRQATVSA